MRVIAGEFRGRRLVAPRDGARPTTDRVKESLFGLIESRLARTRPDALFGTPDVWRDIGVLDLCAGSGALGIEALSRGAAHAVFVDDRPSAIAAIRSNLHTLGLEARSTVLRADVRHATLRSAGNAVIAFLDPPYDEDPTPFLRAIGSGTVAPDLMVTVEHARDRQIASTLGSLTVVRQRGYGATALSVFGRGRFAERDAEDA